jgi:hypothetical protein
MIRVVIFALIAAGAVGFAIYQRAELAQNAGRVAELSNALQAARASEAKALAAEKAARDELASQSANIARLTAERDVARAKAKEAGGTTTAAAAASPSGDAEDASNPMKGFSKMFQSEEGKKMMKSQMGMVTKMQYADLARLLKLSPQEAEQVMTLLSERTQAMAEESFKAMGSGSFDAAGQKEMAAKSEAIKKDYDQKIKAVMGEGKYGELQTYEKSLGDRMMLAQFDQQFASSGAPLQSAQKDQLLSIMADERAKSPPRDFDTTGLNPGKGADLFNNEAAMERFFQQELDYQQRVLRRAPGALGPDQVNALQQAFQQYSEMQKFGMSMAKQMFKPQSGNTGGAPPPPQPVQPPR